MGFANVNVFIILNILLCVSGHVNDVDNFIEDASAGHSLELTQSLNLARQEQIQRACNHSPPKWGLDDFSPSQLEHILIDETHKLLYCYVPKVSLSR